MYLGAGSVSAVKQQNINKIRELLRKEQSVTRTEISRQTGLSIATCGNLLKELISSGEVFPEGYETENGGRPARKYKYNGAYALSAGIAVTVKDSKYIIEGIVSDLHGRILDTRTTECVKPDFKAVSSIIEHMLNDFPNIKSAIIGLPHNLNKLHNEPRLTGEETESDFIDCLKTAHDINLDIKCNSEIAAYGYYCSHDDLKYKTIVLLTADGDSIDAGIVIKGEIYQGDSDAAGEMYIARSETDYEEAVLQRIIYLQRIVDPSVIVITGDMHGIGVEDVIQECRCRMSEWCTPNIIHLESVNNEYINGLINITMKNLEI